MCFNPRDPYTDRDVLSFHDWGVAAGDLAKTLIPCGYDEKKNIEAARHRHLPWIGMMWHPEREERFDAADLEIFLIPILGGVPLETNNTSRRRG